MRMRTPGGDPPVLERDDLLAELRSYLDEASEGRGMMAFVAGEAGIGKTTLVRTLRQDLGDAVKVLWGACDPLSTPRPLSPLLDIAADRDSGISDVMTEGADPYDLFGALVAHLKSGVRPTMVVVEDLHWADQATLDFIRYVGRRVPETKSLVVATFRDDEIGPDHPLRPVLGDLASSRDWVRRLKLPPLSERALEVLAGDREVDVVDLHRITGGNAFFVTEILAGDESLPASVSDAVLARVNRLDTDARRVVEVTSIAPRALEVDYAVRLAGTDLAAAERSVHAGVVIGEGRFLRFRHELARSAVEESMLPARRIDFHRRMVDLLEDEVEPDLARLAHHAVRTGDAYLVHRFAPKAADEAAARGAHRQAAEFLEAAVTHAGGVSPGVEAELRMKLAWELFIINRPEVASEHAAAAVDLHRPSGDRIALGRALSARARIDWNLSPDEARATIQEAISVLLDEPPGQPLAYAYYQAAHFNMLARNHDLAIEFCGKCIETAESVGATDEREIGVLTLGTTELVTGDVDRGIELLLGVIERARTRDDYRRRLVALSMLGTGGGEARRYPDAARWLEEAIGLARGFDEDYTASYSTAWLARIAFEIGDWDRAASLAATVDHQGAVICRLTADGALARVRVRRGDPGAVELLEELRHLGEGQELQHRWPTTAGRAELAWLRGEMAKVEATARPDFERALNTDSPWAKGEMGFWMWRAGGIDEPPEGAAEPWARHIAGDWEAAIRAWQALGCPYEEAMARADSGTEENLRSALDIFQRLGARPAADWTRPLLRELGIEQVPPRPREATRVRPAMLTARQMEVLGLVTEGLTDAEIAERLFISPKTAGHHVSAILRKLGVRSRTEAAAAALKMGIAPGSE